MEYETECLFLCKGELLNTSDPALIGKALASCDFGKRVGIATDLNAYSKSIENSIVGALTAHSSQVWSFGESFFSQFKFFVDFCSLPCGVFASQNENSAKIRVVGRHGLPLCDDERKTLESIIESESFNEIDIASCKEISDMSGVNMMYRRELIRQTDTELSEFSCTVKCDNKRILMLMEDCLYNLGCRKGDEISFKISADGTALSVFTRECGWLSHNKILAIVTNYETQNGRNICVLPSAPLMLDKIAQNNGKKVFRYHGYGDDNDKLLCDDLFMRDALFLSVKLLKILADTGKTLKRLAEELPEFHVTKKKINIDLGNMENIFSETGNSDLRLTNDGAIMELPQGMVRFSRIDNGKKLSIIAEAVNYEASKDLCKFAEDFFKKSK